MLNNFLTVKQAAKYLNKSEETIRRYLRKGDFPNAKKESDTQGWRIPIDDLKKIPSKEKSTNFQYPNDYSAGTSHEKVSETVALAYKTVTLTDPSEELVGILSHIGIHRTLEILLIMQLSPTKVKNPPAFIKKAISKGWTTDTVPIKQNRNVARIQSVPQSQPERKIPFYNWLED
jgi:excisionase family DNA binding protein